MTDIEFLEETHNYLDRCYKEFHIYQNIVNEIFDVFHKICKKNNIPYYVAYGTLLGRIRDNGQIPWDYDCDVCVPIDSVDFLIECLKDELPEDYFFDSNITNSNYNVLMLKIGKKGFDLSRLHVDVFYLFGMPDDEDERDKFQKRIKRIFKARIALYSTSRKKNISKSFIKRNVLSLKRALISFPYNKLLLDYFFRKYSKQYRIVDSKYLVVCADNAEYFPKDVFGTPKICKDVLGEYYAPEDAEKFLHIRYGDYMRYLPIENRFEEFYFFYKHIKE